jgi:hypothetical protein
MATGRSIAMMPGRAGIRAAPAHRRGTKDTHPMKSGSCVPVSRVAVAPFRHKQADFRTARSSQSVRRIKERGR